MSNYRNPAYLGDGTYAQMDEYGDLVLSTGSHIPDNVMVNYVDKVIVLEATVLPHLLNYIDRHAPNGSQNYTIKRIGT
jgi:hypothetical protein